MTLKERKYLEKLCEEANTKCYQWEQSTFDLGSAAQHCGVLSSYASPELKQALKDGKVIIEMPSEYYSPRFKVKE